MLYRHHLQSSAAERLSESRREGCKARTFPPNSRETTLVDIRRSAIIDLMRGLCVLLVVLDHIDLRFRIKKLDVARLAAEPMRQVLFQSGYFAVITFFVLSGFLITGISRERWSSLNRVSVSQFYWLRFARIGPCLVLLVALLSVLNLAQVTEFVIKPNRGTLDQAVFAALTFHVNWLEGRQGYLPGSWDILWSLSVEEVFYLAFPLACLLCRERWLFLLLLALIIVGPLNRAALAGQDPWSEYAYLSCVDGIAFGCLAALLGTRLKIAAPISRLLMILGIACALLVVVFRDTAAALGVPGREYGVTILELGIALILFSMTQGVARAATLPGTRLIQTVGKGSYEIYLTHMLVVLDTIHREIKSGCVHSNVVLRNGSIECRTWLGGSEILFGAHEQIPSNSECRTCLA